MNIQQAYKVCGGIARREAKNFYYAFLALPEAKRNAMYAIYAFMRRADDISDDETQTLDDRRNTMQAWINAWHATQEIKLVLVPFLVDWAVWDAGIEFHGWLPRVSG